MNGGAGDRMMGATGPTKKFDDIFSRLDRMHERNRQADGHRATAKTAQLRLRIASRGKNYSIDRVRHVDRKTLSRAHSFDNG